MISRLADMLRRILETRQSDRLIATTFGVSKTTVRRYRSLAAALNLDMENVAALKPAALHALFNKPRARSTKRAPDFGFMEQELKKKGVTRQLLWEEYREVDPENALSYSQFTTLFRQRWKAGDSVMRQHHRPGERVFVDYSGLLPTYTDAVTGKVIEVQLFIGVLGGSGLMFAYCTPTQKIVDWIDAHVRMFEFFGGVPQVVVPDNLKSAVTKPGSTPLIQRTFLDFAVHYDVSIQPARIYRPQDKALVENSVKCAQSWILAKLRHRTFYTLESLNAAIAEMLVKANERPFQSIEGSRRSRFEDLERDTLRPLPPKRYDYAEWVKTKAVPGDYHVPVEQHSYSVPHTLIGKKVEVRLSSTHVEIFCDGEAVALHSRSATKGGHTTLTDHQPNEHRKQAERTPEGFVAWAKTVGPNTLKIVQHQLSIRTPLAGLPACEAMRKLERNHSPADIEAASARAVKLRVPNPSQVSRFIREPSTRARRDTVPKNQHHANIRGPDYYQGEAQ